MAKRSSAAAVLLLLVAATASAGWIEQSSRDENGAAAGLVHRHLAFANSETGASVDVDLALFSTRSCRLRVIDNPDGSNTLAEALRSANCIAGVNGGYFDPDFAPLGLRIVSGSITSPLRHGRLMSGVIASEESSTRIFRTAEFSSARKFSTAVQCGPFLVDLGRPVRGLEATRSARRSFAAIGSRDRATVGFCSDVTLADLAQILTRPAGDFKIQRALNLDGGSSSAFWFKRGDGSAFSIAEQKNVRDFVAVVAK